MSKPITAYALYAFDALAAKFEKRPIHALESFQRVCNEEVAPPGSHPLFVTWKKAHRHSEADLRGCIGTFRGLDLVKGLPEYALIAANEDHRFNPIAQDELQKLECGVTVLSDFEVVSDPYDWQVGLHGVQATFDGGRSATFLPDVAAEQGWDKPETLLHLAQKAGVQAASVDELLGSMELTRYKGLKATVTYRDHLDAVQYIHQPV